jgi:hypothetical protein
VRNCDRFELILSRAWFLRVKKENGRLGGCPGKQKERKQKENEGNFNPGNVGDKGGIRFASF